MGTTWKGDTEKTVYFVRHGQSEANVGHVFQGHDSALTEHGREQARAIADRASRLPIEVIITSPWERARDTAHIIAELIGKPVEESGLFVERQRPSRLRGKSKDDPEAIELNRLWDESIFGSGSRTEDGENFEDFRQRILEALQYLADRSEKHVLVVTHGTFTRCLLACVVHGRHLTPEELRRFQKKFFLHNTGLTLLGYDTTLGDVPWGVRTWNDHAHLG